METEKLDVAFVNAQAPDEGINGTITPQLPKAIAECAQAAAAAAQLVLKEQGKDGSGPYGSAHIYSPAIGDIVYGDTYGRCMDARTGSGEFSSPHLRAPGGLLAR